VKHPLGFSEIQLLKFGPVRILIHIYGGDSGREDIHSHRWDFISVIVRGSLYESRYELEPGTELKIHDLAGVKRDGFRPLSDRTWNGKTCRAIERFRVRRKAPHAYSAHARELHRIEPGKNLVTVFIQISRKDSPDSSVVLTENLHDHTGLNCRACYNSEPSQWSREKTAVQET
jgi:hypothetical protein